MGSSYVGTVKLPVCIRGSELALHGTQDTRGSAQCAAYELLA